VNGMHQAELQDRVPGLDGLRGLAVLYTTLCHIRHIPIACRDVFSAQGVTIFYVLSGYLVTGLLYDAQVRASGAVLRNGCS
jgi:peptidoglycan/LPS O-acetylase OafA/YrhL